MKQTDQNPPDYRKLPFWLLVHNWRVEDQGNRPIKDVADEFGVDDSLWSRWETGVRFPSPAMVQPLSDFLHIPPCGFFCGPGWRCPRCVRRGARPVAGVGPESSEPRSGARG